MPTEPVRFSRTQLHDLLWSTPITKIAERLGITYLDIVAACKRHRVPRPPLGYWARKAQGQACPRSPLPELASEEVETIVITTAPKAERPRFERSDRAESEVSPAVGEYPEIAALIATEQARPPVVVPVQLTRPHPAVQLTRTGLSLAIQRGQADPFGMYLPTGLDHGRMLYVAVSRRLVRRAMLVCDVLLKELARLGASVEPGDNTSERGLRVKLLGESLWIKVRERAKQQAKVDERNGWRKYNHIPTGQVYIELHASYGHRRTWTDSEDRLLEVQIRSMVIGALQLIVLARKQGEYWRRWREEREAEEQRRREAEERRRQEEAQVRTLLGDVRNWNLAKQIRRYVSAVQNAGRAGSPQVQRAIATWATWAEQVAARHDPLSPDALQAKFDASSAEP